MEQGFLFQDLIYVIDFMGVQARKSDERYVARSYPLASFQDLRSQLALGRPVLVGVSVYGSWFQEPSSKTGVIDVLASDPIQGGVIGAVVGWDPRKEEMKILMPWPGWGDHGIATLSRPAAEKSIDQHQMRSIEVAPMPPGVAERLAERSSPADEAQDGKTRRRNRSTRRAT
jgi:hypothetical protein